MALQPVGQNGQRPANGARVPSLFRDPVQAILEQSMKISMADADLPPVLGKMLAVSQRFRNISNHEGIYRFCMDVYEDWSMFHLQEVDGLDMSYLFELELEEARGLILFLNPSRIGVYVYLDGEQDSPFLDLLRHTTGKMILFFPMNPRIAANLIDTYWTRLTELTCDYSNLQHRRRVIQLDYLGVFGFTTTSDLNTVLSMNPATFEIGLDDDFRFDRQVVLLQASRARVCTIRPVSQRISHLGLIQSLSESCPNLRRLDIDCSDTLILDQDGAMNMIARCFARAWTLYNRAIEEILPLNVESSIVVHLEFVGDGGVVNLPLLWMVPVLENNDEEGENIKIKTEIADDGEFRTALLAEQAQGRLEAKFRANFRYRCIEADLLFDFGEDSGSEGQDSEDQHAGDQDDDAMN